MSSMSTYSQNLSAPNGIGGKTLKEKFLEDGIIYKDKDSGDYYFDDTKINGIHGHCYKDFGNDTCFSDDGKAVACILSTGWHDDHGIGIDDSFLNDQTDAVKELSKHYPDSTFSLYASYCPGGCGLRTTAIDDYITNGEITDSKGKPCISSVVVPKSYFSRAEDPDKVRYNFYQRDLKNSVGYCDIPRSDFEVEDDDWVRLYWRKESDGILPDVMKDCEVHKERDIQAEEDEMYGVERDFDDEYC